MNDPNFAIQVDPVRRLVILTLQGAWTAATVDRYDEPRRRAFAELASSGDGHFAVLVDRSALGPQPRDVVERFGRVVAEDDGRVRRVAIVVSGILSKFQIERLSRGRSNARTFTRRADALAWLLSEDDRGST